MSNNNNKEKNHFEIYVIKNAFIITHSKKHDGVNNNNFKNTLFNNNNVFLYPKREWIECVCVHGLDIYVFFIIIYNNPWPRIS